MRVLVSGDRNYKYGQMIKAVLDGVYREWFQSGFPDTLNEEFVVIHGCARGADTLAGEVAKRMSDVTVEEYPAKWDEYGRAAGPIRNQQMLDEGKPNVVFCFHDDFENSKGTKHMANAAKKAGIPVYLITRL